MTGSVSSATLKHGTTVGIRPAFPSPERVELDVAITPLPFSSTPPDNTEDVVNNPILHGIRLADGELGGPIDLIVGTYDQPHFLLNDPLKSCLQSRITGISTIFGWTVAGPSTDGTITTLSVELQQNNLDTLLTRMYLLEKVPAVSRYSPEEESALHQFRHTVQVQADGRYSVSLPRVDNPPALGKSRKMATSCFINNERSLKKKDRLQSFNKEMASYLELKHAEVVPEPELGNDHYYLPVHGVFKDHSTTTKVRPVFDGSARTSTGASLNDLLLSRPNLYSHIEDILLMFRLHPIAFSADISKMFREIQLHSPERDLHWFLTRDSSGNIQDCRMTRLTFGVKSSPFLATSVLLHLAGSHQSSHPLACHSIRTHFYVDDLLTGANNLQEAVAIRESVCSLLSEANMTLRKWRTNNDSFRNTIPPELVETADLEIPAAQDSIKALGIHWEVSCDCLHVSSPKLPQSSTVTKRIISSIAAQIYDVLGFFAPFVVIAKALLQELWLKKLGWDDEVPDDILQRWLSWTKELPLITDHAIQRKYFDITAKVASTSLQGFSDASEVAYGAVIYLRRVFEDGTISTAFVMAKARVRPLKVTTIPKLELQAATLMTELLVYSARIFNIPLSKVQPWTDSTIVIGWLRMMSHAITEVFVRNRVAAIQEALPDAFWRHVPSSSNPADLASRGCNVSEIINSSLWWLGPTWLSCPEHSWPATKATPLPRSLPGVKAAVLSTALLPVEVWDLWSRYSSYTALVRVLSWLRRFIHNCRSTSPPIKAPILTSEELASSRKLLILQQQHQSFPEVFQWLKKGKSIPGSHCLAGMVVFLDETTKDETSNIIKVTGRVRAEASSKPRELTPLSLKCNLTKLLVTTEHQKQLHPGTSILISILGHSFFIPGLRAFLKKLSKKCATCQQVNARPISQQMGLLPSARTSPSPPFSVVGIDFAGPFILKRGHTRKPVKFKAYSCLFICLFTKAVHLEVCSSLETEEFLAAFRRFANRRGTPHAVYSDNGSNFIGAKAELKATQRLLFKSSNAISHLSAAKEIEWHTIPPRSPHFGGLWESGVREMKRLMKKIISPHPLRFEEFESVLIEVEASLNS